MFLWFLVKVGENKHIMKFKRSKNGKKNEIQEYRIIELHLKVEVEVREI